MSLYQADGTYTEVPAAIVGSYVEFSMEKEGIFQLTEREDTSKMKIAIGAGLLVLAAACILVGRHVHKRRRKNQGKED